MANLEELNPLSQKQKQTNKQKSEVTKRSSIFKRRLCITECKFSLPQNWVLYCVHKCSNITDVYKTVEMHRTVLWIDFLKISENRLANWQQEIQHELNIYLNGDTQGKDKIK